MTEEYNFRGRDRDEWLNYLSNQELQEIKFARIYARDFGPGPAGHNHLLLIAKLADMLTAVCDEHHDLIQADLERDW